jgi:Zn-dependent protease
MANRQPGPSMSGSFRLFRVAGISVYMHWSWLVVAFIEFRVRRPTYDSPVWSIAEYLTLFLIVLLHEFGHALACRQVGGQANEIVLWPLGGIAYVQPPPRPGAFLWSIAAGPLVNALLVPVTVGAALLAGHSGLAQANPDADRFVMAVTVMNISLLVFNLLPIYPLDGGQILQALLWFVIGRARSLMVVSIIGLVAGVAVVGLALALGNWWLVIMAVFIAMRCFSGFQQARLLARVASLPRHQNASCPSCHTQPIMGDHWTCSVCRTKFDTFAHNGVCPGCGEEYSTTACPACGQSHPIDEWFAAAEKSGGDDSDKKNEDYDSYRKYRTHDDDYQDPHS